jgi:hypothetical protein
MGWAWNQFQRQFKKLVLLCYSSSMRACLLVSDSRADPSLLNSFFSLQNLSVEMQVENLHEVSMDHFKAELEKAGGAR